MNFFRELREFLQSILIWLYVFLFIGIFIFLFGIKEVTFYNIDLSIPLPTLKSFAVSFFNLIQNDLLPRGVTLIVTNPLSAFITQVSVSFFLSFIISFPFLVYRVVGFLRPALYDKEKKAFSRIFFPSFFLFIFGNLFAYFFLIPPTFRILYLYTTNIGALPFFSVNEFTSSVFILILVTGILFLLPIFMYLLTKLKIVEPDFWKNNWRYAISVCLIFSAIITPDGTGVTMMILSIPLTLLYFIGMFLSRK